MDFRDSNAAASASAARGLSALGNFLLNRAQFQIDKPRVEAETQETKARAKGIRQEARRNQYLFEHSIQPVTDLQTELTKQRLNALGQAFGQVFGENLSQPEAQPSGISAPSLSLDLNPRVHSPVSSPTAPVSEQKPALGMIPHVSTVTAPGVAPRETPTRYKTLLGKDGNLDISVNQELTPEEIKFIDEHPDQVHSGIPQEKWPAADAHLATVGKSLTNTKTAAEAEQALLNESYGNPEERRAHHDFSLNAGALSRRLDEYADTVNKYGNYEWLNPEGAAKLSSLPLDIADNWTKITNPGGVLREGLVHLGKELQIPTSNDNWYGAIGIGPRNATTLEAIKQTKNVLADYVRQYENLPYTKVPVIGLTPELRAMVGPTQASEAYEKSFGKPVPVESGRRSVSDYKPKATSPENAAPGSSPETAIPVNSPDEYEKLQPLQYYRDSHGNTRQKRPVATAPASTLPPLDPNSFSSLLVNGLMNSHAVGP